MFCKKSSYIQKVANIYVVYETDYFQDVGNYPTLRNALFGAVDLTKSAEINKYRYFGYGAGFDGRGFYSRSSRRTRRNVIIFVANMSSSVYVYNKGKDIFTLGKGPTQGLGEHSLAAEKCIRSILPNLIQNFV